jgi:prepilin signal peptidase PulO-like enzyme (type II secretory pathway)
MAIVFLGILGLCIGSFVCATMWRLHEQMRLHSKKKLSAGDNSYAQALSIRKGRSMCGHCRHSLASKDLVPLLSWLWLRGKCRYCQKPIGWLEPLAEAGTAVLFIGSYLFWPLPWNGQGVFDFIVWLVLLAGFVALSIYDFKWYLLPDKIVLPLTVLTVVKVFVDVVVFHGGTGGLMSALWGALVIGGMFYGLFALSGGRWIGGGDVKIAVMLGLLAGSPLKALFVIFFSSVLGMLAALPLLARGKATRNSHIPFGPFLLAATILVVLFGDSIVHAYEVLFVIN